MVRRSLLPAFTASLTLGLMLGPVACDDKTPPAPPVPKKEAPPTPKAPTTQQILEGPRKRIQLNLIPFSVEVPEGWEVKVHGASEKSISILEGPMVNGEAHLVLGLRDRVSAERLKLRLEAAEKERPAIEKSGGFLNVRETPTMTIVETRRLPKEPAATTQASTPKVTDPTGEPVVETEPLLEWRVELFVPAGIMYEQYVISFIDFNEKNFKDNATLFRQILDSIKPGEAELPPLPR